MIADRRLRDSAKSIVAADWAHVKADLQHRGLGGRAKDRLTESATDVYDEAIAVANDHKGALAAIAAALVVWFARHPIIEAFTGPPHDDDGYDPDYDD